MRRLLTLALVAATAHAPAAWATASPLRLFHPWQASDEQPQPTPPQLTLAYAPGGQASWYGPGFHGSTTANGETYDQWASTAAHPSLPFGTRVRVVNTSNGRSAVVRINDRGPYYGGRVIDLSRAAAERLGMIDSGTASVRLEVLN